MQERYEARCVVSANSAAKNSMEVLCGNKCGSKGEGRENRAKTREDAEMGEI